MSFPDFHAEQQAKMAAQIARQNRLLNLAMQNGWRCDVVQLEHVEGEWWRVPVLWEPIVGCHMARVE